MEAVWTRFFPLTFALEEALFKEAVIGEIRRLEADFSIDFIDGKFCKDPTTKINAPFVLETNTSGFDT